MNSIIILNKLLFEAVFFRGFAGESFEDAVEVALRGKAEIGADGNQGFVCIAQKSFGFGDFFFLDKIGDVFARIGFEF